jgi:hypothetical protein
MVWRNSTFNIFNEQRLSDFLSSRKESLKREVLNESEDSILNYGETEYVKYLADQYSVENIEIGFDDVFASQHEKEISSDRFPRSFHVRHGQKYRKDVFRYHLPFKGNNTLLKCEPSSRLMWTLQVQIIEKAVCFDLVDFHDDVAQIKNEAQSNMGSIRKQAENVRKQVQGYNSSLRKFAEQTFQDRKRTLLKKNDKLAKLGVPIKKKDDVPETFSVPSPDVEKRIRIRKPEVKEAGFQPEPTLDADTYSDILRVIDDVGRQFERMPSTYKDKCEEDLRDHFLFHLEPNFEGSATGETFNKSGKTDILLRYEGENVFIAECKFWKGQKGFKETISQLLGYLTWRDSKAAIVLFVKNKDFSAVLEQIPSAGEEHDNFVDFKEQSAENRFDFVFHLNGDPNREVACAVMLYHIPSN